jgi:hypothetical protein
LGAEAVLSGWGDFAVVMGAATASLLGLFFVAVSIRVETIARSAELLNRSAGDVQLEPPGLAYDVTAGRASDRGAVVFLPMSALGGV